MNHIPEKDWAEESWGGHSGMDGNSDWCKVDKIVNEKPAADPGGNEGSLEEKKTDID